MQNISNQARPTYEIDLGEKIICFDSSQPSIHGESVILIGLKRKILIISFDISEDFNFNYKRINEIPESETRILKLCSQVIARDIHFVSCSNYSINVFSANDLEFNCLAKIDAHTSFINAVDFTDEYIVSGSDDNTAKIFSVKENYEQHSVLCFDHSVTNVKFNSNELNKILISVKNGKLFIYCLKLRQSLYSFYTQAPLMHFDWSLKNPAILSAICSDQIFYFDISKPDLPICSKRLNDVAKIISIHPQNPLISAVICNRAGNEVKVVHQKSTISNLFSTKIIAFAGNIAWYHSFLIVGSDRKMCFFKIPIA